jgi:hypothetical protein
MEGLIIKVRILEFIRFGASVHPFLDKPQAAGLMRGCW